MFSITLFVEIEKQLVNFMFRISKLCSLYEYTVHVHNECINRLYLLHISEPQ